MSKGIYIKTFGCQMNVLDSETLEGEFAAEGYVRVDDAEDADVVIFNTCSVREHAENKVLSHIGRLKFLKLRRPEVTVIVAGCMAERMGEQIRTRYPQVDIVVGTRRLGECLRLAAQGEGCGVFIGAEGESYPVRDVRLRASRSQAYVSVMRGCDNFCAYCIVPYVRGRQASRPEGEILDEIKALADDGVREVTLLGQNVTAYGHDRGEKGSLYRLLECLEGIAGIEWVKFITSHPRDTGEDIFRAMRDLPKVCRYLHLPAQSGSDKILAAMGRGYTRAQYLRKVEMVRETAGEVSIAGDFIVGFPGEGERDFADTVELVREVGYKNSFIFKYSAREGTRGALLRDDVPAGVKKRRNNELLAVQEEASLGHNRSLVGKTVRVLVGGHEKKGGVRLAGRTEGEEIVVFEGPEELAGGFGEVEITAATATTLFGEFAGQRE